MTYQRKEQIGNCTLYLGDCREVLPTLDKVDAVVTDPPYGIDGSSGTINLERGKGNYSGDFQDTREAVELVFIPAVAMALEKSDGLGAVTPGLPNMWLYPEPDGVAALLQPASRGLSKWGACTWQPMLFYGRDPYLGKKINRLDFSSRMQPEKNGHPCPKSLDVMEWAVSRVSMDNHIILDPFMGSGTTGVACAKSGRHFIGIEIDEDYFDIACQRIREAYSQPDMFVDSSVSPND